jgi:hypothetical protein
MSRVEYALGNILIKHQDVQFKRTYYLTEELIFSSKREEAARFYFLKPGDTEVLNGDRISINCGNRTLIMMDDGTLRLVERDQIKNNVDSFIITDGTDSIMAIAYNKPFYLLKSKEESVILRFYWGMDLIGQVYQPSAHPVLKIDDAHVINATEAPSLQFRLESTNGPMGRPRSNSITLESQQSVTDSQRNILIITILMILLVLAILARN